MVSYKNSYEERCLSYSLYEAWYRHYHSKQYRELRAMEDRLHEEDMAQQEIMRLTGTIVGRSVKAIKFAFESQDGEDRVEWFPLSQVTYIFDSKDEGCDMIDVPVWIMKKNGLL